MPFSAFIRLAVCTALLTALLPAANARSGDSHDRLNFIQQQFDQTAAHSQWWQYGWLGLFSGAAAVSAVAWSQTEDKHNRYDRKVGFTTSFLGAADLLINPMQTHRYAAALSAMPDHTEEQQTARLAQAEIWLAASAERERYEQSLLNHALSGLVNGLAGLAVAYDDRRPDDGWVTFISGVIVSEVKIYTAPQTMMTAEQRYQSGNYAVTAAKADAPHWQIAAFGPVLSATYRF